MTTGRLRKVQHPKGVLNVKTGMSGSIFRVLKTQLVMSGSIWRVLKSEKTSFKMGSQYFSVARVEHISLALQCAL
jgi:hypothetical protein